MLTLITVGENHNGETHTDTVSLPKPLSGVFTLVLTSHARNQMYFL